MSSTGTSASRGNTCFHIVFQWWQTSQNIVYAHHYFAVMVVIRPAARSCVLNVLLKSAGITIDQVCKRQIATIYLFKYFDSHVSIELLSFIILCILVSPSNPPPPQIHPPSPPSARPPRHRPSVPNLRWGRAYDREGLWVEIEGSWRTEL